MHLNITHTKTLHIVSDHRAHNGIFAEEFKAKLPKFCPWIGGDLQVYDANGDGYDDLTCHTSTGIIEISESHIVDISKFNFAIWLIAKKIIPCISLEGAARECHN